jgi:copper chaperone CopZ
MRAENIPQQGANILHKMPPQRQLILAPAVFACNNSSLPETASLARELIRISCTKTDKEFAMRPKAMITTLIACTALALIAVLAQHVRIGATADTVAVIRTGGMTCESCAGKISRALQREPGVAATEVDIAGGWVVVGFDSKKTRPDILAQTVTAAGFSTGSHSLLTPEKFRQLTGRDVGMNDTNAGGCCGGKGGGCSADRKKS